MEYFLEKYGKDYWCLVVDIDELFHFPAREKIPLKGLIDYLEHYQFTAVRCLLLDMYSDTSIAETAYRQNEDPLECCPFFDTSFWIGTFEFFDKKHWKNFEFQGIMGGVRTRVFTKRNQHPFCLTKVSLMKYSEDTYLVQGMHAINNANIADIEGVVFHTKFMSDFVSKARDESLRQEHFNNGEEYKRYNYFLTKNNQISLKYEDSVRFENSDQLISLGLMRSSDQYVKYFK